MRLPSALTPGRSWAMRQQCGASDRRRHGSVRIEASPCLWPCSPPVQAEAAEVAQRLPPQARWPLPLIRERQVPGLAAAVQQLLQVPGPRGGSTAQRPGRCQRWAAQWPLHTARSRPSSRSRWLCAAGCGKGWLMSLQSKRPFGRALHRVKLRSTREPCSVQRALCRTPRRLQKRWPMRSGRAWKSRVLPCKKRLWHLGKKRIAKHYGAASHPHWRTWTGWTSSSGVERRRARASLCLDQCTQRYTQSKRRSVQC
mmetsp:Transcript_85761/g.142134  ORF Transcript_85761/g.142134 Transcript_85761/m.142134 type:complete len:255 (-) Transcript_85761:389-1153(-)